MGLRPRPWWEPEGAWLLEDRGVTQALAAVGGQTTLRLLGALPKGQVVGQQSQAIGGLVASSGGTPKASYALESCHSLRRAHPQVVARLH